VQRTANGFATGVFGHRWPPVSKRAT